MKRDLEDGPPRAAAGRLIATHAHLCSGRSATTRQICRLKASPLFIRPKALSPQGIPRSRRARSKTGGPHPTALDPHPLPGGSRSCARPSSQAFTDSRAHLAAARLRRLSSFKPPSLQLWSAARCARLLRKRLHSLPGHACILGALRGLVIRARPRHSPAKRLAHRSPASHY